MEKWIAHFVIKKPVEYVSKVVPCCKYKKLVNNNGSIVCIDFGQVERYDMVDEYIDSVYENRNEIKRKSIYRCEYHVNNSIDKITCKNNTVFS